MTVTAPPQPPSRGMAWGLAWALVAALVVGGVALALRHLDDILPAIAARA